MSGIRATATSMEVTPTKQTASGPVRISAVAHPDPSVAQRAAPTVHKRRRSFVPWWFALPGISLYLALVLWPSAQGVMLSLTDWNGVDSQKNYVGLKNFAAIFSRTEDLSAVTRTLIIAASLVVAQNLVGLLLALALNTRLKSRLVLRTAFFAPAVLSSVVLGYTFKFVFSPEGPLNAVLSTVGIRNPPNWLGEPRQALFVIIFVLAWQSVGSSMVIYLAGLQRVPRDLIEAASIDGAGAVRRFFSVTLPHLAPAVTINSVLTLIAGLRVFDQVYVMTGGGPANGTQTISTLLVQEAFKFMHYGYAAALAVVLSVMIAALSVVQLVILRRQRAA